MLVLCFDISDLDDVNKCLSLLDKLATSKPPGFIKY